MIPTKTLRERMTQALMGHVGNLCDDAGLSETVAKVTLETIVGDAIDAIGDPCLIKTADSLEPTFTLRAQDMAAEYALAEWCKATVNNQVAAEKRAAGHVHVHAFRAWPTRKWPD